MKPTIIFTLSFILFAFITTHIPLAFSQRQLVRDTDGNPLIGLGGGYYILPSTMWGLPGGGVWPGKTGNQTSPVTVLQDYSEVVWGEPVKFDTGSRPGHVSIDEPLDITFAKKPHGASSSKWVVISDDFPRSWVGVGGAEDHPGKQILRGKFSIQNFDFGYKLVFYPSNTAPPGRSYDIGRHDAGEKGRRLVLSDPAIEVVFVEATGHATNGIKSVV